MKLTRIALGVSLGLGGLIANAADVAMFPYVVNSSSVTTIVTVVDQGGNTASRYDAEGNPSVAGKRLHWHLDYKPITNFVTLNNDSPCSTTPVDAYLPSAPNDIQTVDLGGNMSGPNQGGLLFRDTQPGMQTTDSYALIKKSGVPANTPVRGVLFVHNSDASGMSSTSDYNSYATVRGEAMVFEFGNGSAWGYTAEVSDSLGGNRAANFDFSESASNYYVDPVVSFMPPLETNTRLLVTPVNNEGGSMLSANGKGTNNFSAKIGLKGSMFGADGSAFNRNGEPVTGLKNVTISCVGGVSIFGDLVPSAVKQHLMDGGYGLLSLSGGNTPYAIVFKAENGLNSRFNEKPTSKLNNVVKL